MITTLMTINKTVFARVLSLVLDMVFSPEGLSDVCSP